MWLAVFHMHAELDASRIALAWINTESPLEPWLALGSRASRVGSHGLRFEDGPRCLFAADSHAPVAKTVGFLVSDEGIVIIIHRIVSVEIAELLILCSAWDGVWSVDELCWVHVECGIVGIGNG